MRPAAGTGCPQTSARYVFLRRLLLEGAGERPVRVVALREEDDAGRPDVEAVDEERERLSRRKAAGLEQAADGLFRRSRARGRPHRDARRLAQRENVRALEEDHAGSVHVREDESTARLSDLRHDFLPALRLRSDRYGAPGSDAGRDVGLLRERKRHGGPVRGA